MRKPDAKHNPLRADGTKGGAGPYTYKDVFGLNNDHILAWSKWPYKKVYL